MAEQRRKKKSNALVWAILGLLVLALGGFGIGGFGGSLTSVARVGDREITVQDYANAIQSEQARLQQQTGQRLTLQQMQMFGLDRQVMERLLAGAALEHEADRVGLSVGDAVVVERIRQNPAFGGVDGTFDREGYSFALDNANLDEARYEARVRDEIARELLQAAVVGGTAVPDAYADAMAAWIAESRDITLATVTEADLPGGTVAPTEDDLRAFHDENPERFETPERRAITYAWLAPDRLAGEIEMDEDALRDLYEQGADEYRQPARVLAERLAFADGTEAAEARAALDAGEITFDALVAERGLTLDDVDQGELARDDLDAPLGEALFALDEPGLVGPVETDLGPAIYRVNAVLDATEIPFEDVRDDLARSFGMEAARRRIAAAREGIDDLLAGGATLEELGGETDMIVGKMEWDPTVSDGIAGYEAFRAAVQSVEAGDFPELLELADGGLFALRLDEVIAPTTPPLEEIREEVELAWTADTRRWRLFEQASELARNPTRDIAGPPEVLTGLVRDAPLEGTPPALLDRVFAAEPGEVFAFEGDDQRAYVVRVDAVNAADLSTGEAANLREAIVSQTRTEIAGDLFEGYRRAIQTEAGFEIDAQALAAIQTQLGG
ncbi:SurA N-terminal domain-containing protein [Jannaschia sp. S6380]|uniref:peptidylprolyl isomerase n=1 Tax=Jannaschia sp. S6380 TaxID=2926408 RepID=UPI001FF404CB|nr:peptidylprolyl isomerase [Jannaschia sp. S6380]MCK0167000.1 SurA N-terminal domain-containing protein [Jannaschia sp. S6380]